MAEERRTNQHFIYVEDKGRNVRSNQFFVLVEVGGKAIKINQFFIYVEQEERGKVLTNQNFVYMEQREPYIAWSSIFFM